MAYRVTRRNGERDLVGNDFARYVAWAHEEDRGWAVVKCEWVEPKKETRWRIKWSNGETRDHHDAPLADMWTQGHYRDYVLSCERVEVET